MSSDPAATFYKILTSAFCNLLDAHAVLQRTGGIALERSSSHEPNSDFLAPEWQNYQRSTWLQKHPIFVNLEVRRNVLNITRVFPKISTVSRYHIQLSDLFYNCGLMTCLLCNSLADDGDNQVLNQRWHLPARTNGFWRGGVCKLWFGNQASGKTDKAHSLWGGKQ